MTRRLFARFTSPERAFRKAAANPGPMMVPDAALATDGLRKQDWTEAETAARADAPGPA
jgi:hypothetical protein